MSITVTLNKVELDAEERRNRALRAAEILEGASWLFDEFISERTRDLIATEPSHPDARATVERAYVEVRVAMNLKAHLLTIVQQHQAEVTLNERRERAERPADHE